MFISDAMARLGPRRVVLIGTCLLATAVLSLAFVAAPWQLYAAYLILATGAAAMHTGAITTIVGLWFNQRRGFAISLALNGASFGGILVTPTLVFAIERFGFKAAMIGAAAIIVVQSCRLSSPASTGRGAPRACPLTRRRLAAWTRPGALRSWAFWSVAGPFALALMAQIGFIVHQIAFLEPRWAAPAPASRSA